MDSCISDTVVTSYEVEKRLRHVVMITTYNPDVLRTTKFIQQICCNGCTVCIVDNASSNITEFESSISEQDFDGVVLYKLPINRGIAYAQNFGVQKYSQLNKVDDFILTFFDQDSSIDGSFLKQIELEFMRISSSSDEPCIIGPDIYDESSGKRLVRSKYSFFRIVDQDHTSDLIPVDFVISSGMTLLGSDFLNTGGNDEKLFIGYVDIEFCLRASVKFNFNVYITKKVNLNQNIGLKMIECFGRLVPLHLPIRRYYMTRNSIYLISKSHIPLGFKLRELFMSPVRLIFDLVLQKDKTAFIFMGTKGFKDGFSLFLKT